MSSYINSADFEALLAAKDVDQLIAVLKRGGTRALQMDAAIALGRLGNEKAVAPLSSIINNKYEWIGTRLKSIEALGHIGGKKAAKLLKELTTYKDFHGDRNDVLAIQAEAKSALNRLGEV